MEATFISQIQAKAEAIIQACTNYNNAIEERSDAEKELTFRAENGRIWIMQGLSADEVKYQFDKATIVRDAAEQTLDNILRDMDELRDDYSGAQAIVNAHQL